MKIHNLLHLWHEKDNSCSPLSYSGFRINKAIVAITIGNTCLKTTFYTLKIIHFNKRLEMQNNTYITLTKTQMIVTRNFVKSVSSA